jgi:hypothetical protein
MDNLNKLLNKQVSLPSSTNEKLSSLVQWVNQPWTREFFRRLDVESDALKTVIIDGQMISPIQLVDREQTIGNVRGVMYLKREVDAVLTELQNENDTKGQNI